MVVIIVFYEVELGTPAPRVDNERRREEGNGTSSHVCYSSKILL